VRPRSARPNPPSPRTPRAGLLAILCALVALLPACGERTYSQSSPEEVVRSARAMVEHGDTAKLVDLLYADNDQMRLVYQRMGRLLTSLDALARVVAEKFPDDIERIKKQAVEGGNPVSNLFQQISASQRRRGGSNADRPDPQQLLTKAAQTFLADPYGWVREGEQRITFATIDDERVALLWDSKPVFPPFGVTMQKVDDAWYLIPPINLPVVSRFLPQTEKEYEVVGLFMIMLRRVADDLRADIESGKIRSLEKLSEEAGAKAFVPGAMIFFSYGKLIEDRVRAQSRPRPAPDAATEPAPPAAENPG
jgi:hypothetical protein